MPVSAPSARRLSGGRESRGSTRYQCPSNISSVTPPRATAPATAAGHVPSEAETIKNPSAAVPKPTAAAAGWLAAAAAASKAMVAIPAGTPPPAAQAAPPNSNPTPAANHRKPGPTTRQAAITAAPAATPADQVASTSVGLRVMSGPYLRGRASLSSDLPERHLGSGSPAPSTSL